MGPAKTYHCKSCNAAITVSPTSNRVLIYGGLIIFVPVILYFKVEPGLFSAGVVGLVFAVLITLTIFTQKVIHAKT